MHKTRGTTPRRHTGAATLDPVTGFAGSIAHDFSNLLMIIRNAAGFLRDDLEESDPRQRHVSDLLQASDRARQLTEQLQAIGRSQLLKPEPVRPAEAIHGISDTLRHLVPDDVELRIVIRSRQATVLFDAAQLPIVVMRLLSYAADQARSHGQLRLIVDEVRIDRARAAAHEVKAGPYVSITVVCPEQALDASEALRAFLPRLAGKQLPRGTDLRLASVHGVVRQSGGFVELASETERGLALGVYLPGTTAQPERKPAHGHRARPHRDVSGDEIILVVEDDAGVRATVREALERYGYTVLVAADGDAALRLVQLLTTPPDLLLTDLVMPEVTGRELIESLEMEGSLPKVLMMSGYTDDDVLRRSRPSEGYPFIKKPFTHQELALKIRQTLDAEPGVP